MKERLHEQPASLRTCKGAAISSFILKLVKSEWIIVQMLVSENENSRGGSMASSSCPLLHQR